MKDREVDRFYHLKFKKWAFMKGFGNFVPGPSNIPHWDALFKIYGPREELYSDKYGAKYTLELNNQVLNFTRTDTKDGSLFTTGIENDPYVVIKNFGFVPLEKEFMKNEETNVSEEINGYELLDAERKAALNEFQIAKLVKIDILFVKDLFLKYMEGAKYGVREDGTIGYLEWTPWIEALTKILDAHPIKRATVPVYRYNPGRTIKGANIELRIKGEIYRTADFYWHSDITSSDAVADLKTLGDYGGFKTCSAEENYSFASFHFEPVKAGYLPIRAIDE